MKRIVYSCLLLLGMQQVTAQQIVQTNINDKLEELFIKKDKDAFSQEKGNAVEQFFTQNSALYYFDLQYQGQVLLREAIPKSKALTRDSDIMEGVLGRFKFKLQFDASLISDAERLALFEDRKITVQTIADKKIVTIDNFEILAKDYKTEQYKINNPSENLKINIYKLSFE